MRDIKQCACTHTQAANACLSPDITTKITIENKKEQKKTACDSYFKND